MGYDTYLYGEIDISPAIPDTLAEYINKFCETRRMKRDVSKLQAKFNGGQGYYGDYGIEGAYFVGGSGCAGQDIDETVIDGNKPPEGVPEIWMDYLKINSNSNAIVTNDETRSYHIEESIKYVIDHFIAPTGSLCNGEIECVGQDRDDRFAIVVEDNVVSTIDMNPTTLLRQLEVKRTQIQEAINLMDDPINLLNGYIDILNQYVYPIDPDKVKEFALTVKKKLEDIKLLL